MTKPILYSYFRSSCSWRVRIVLALKGIDYQYKPVNILTGEQHSEEFVRINPIKQVPVLVVPDRNNFAIAQSTAIVYFLDEEYPKRAPLLPVDPLDRAHARAIADTINSLVQPIQNPSFIKRVQNVAGDDGRVNGTEWARNWIEEQFAALEKMIAHSAGKYCVKDSVSIADVYLVPQVANANRFGVNLSRFPLINQINDRLMELDAFKDSAPDRMPDSPQLSQGAPQ